MARVGQTWYTKRDVGVTGSALIESGCSCTLYIGVLSLGAVIAEVKTMVVEMCSSITKVPMTQKPGREANIVIDFLLVGFASCLSMLGQCEVL